MLKIINNLCKDFNIENLSLKNFKDLDLFQEKNTGDNLLIYAARIGNLNLLRLLHDKHESDANYFNYTNKDGKNALHEACQNEHLDCVKFLVQIANIDVNRLRKGDWTPLMLACTRNNLEIIEFLVEHKADLSQRNKDGWTAFQIAIREGHQDIIEYLLYKDSPSTLMVRSKNGRIPFHTACLHGHLSAVKLLLNENIHQIEAKDSCGITPFMDALQADHLNLIEYLINNSTLIDIKDKDKLGNSCIHLMAQSGSINCLKFLFYKYYSEQATLLDDFKSTLNDFKMTPMHSACKNNKPDILEYFLNELSQNNANDLLDLIEQPDSHSRSSFSISQSMAVNFIVEKNKSNDCILVLNKFRGLFQQN